MELCQYPDFESHQHQHNKLTEKVDQLAKDWHDGPGSESLSELRDFMRNWLYNHIIKIDTTMAPFAKGKDQAIRQALEKME